MSLAFPTEPTITLRVFVLCDQHDTAPIWGYIIREKGLIAILETSVQRAITRSGEFNADLIIIDVNASHQERILLCQQFRAITESPILLFLPANNEAEIIEAYQIGVDECVVKPISPALFVAKIMAWGRRGRSVPVTRLDQVGSGSLRLDPARRSAVDPGRGEIKLTNLEFRLLHLLMSRPGHIFSAEEIIQSVWGIYGQEDQSLLKNVVYRLRKKLGTEASEQQFVQTWPGGYSFQEK
ncbi:MAG: response regulator transcription factor [Anaerolineales bacterium]|nr:response regulator transcription factor [Anaerolineales bacterium]